MRPAGRSYQEQLLEAVVERENMWSAHKQVERNKGAAGVDNMTVEQLRAYLREHWLQIKEEPLTGGYQPSAVRKVAALLFLFLLYGIVSCRGLR